jgi:small-conductance mechanosensitive channel
VLDDIRRRLDDAGEQLIALGVAVAQLLLVIVCAAVVARWARRRMRRRFRADESPVLGAAAENAAAVGIYVVALTIVLGLWGLTWSSLITALSIGTVAVAFGLQDLLRSIVGGMLIFTERPFAPGDRIKIKEAEGKVEAINLRTTVIVADNGDRITVPNALLFTDPVVNRGPRPADRTITVSGLAGNPAELKRRARGALAGLPGLDGEAGIVVRAQRHRTRARVRRALDALPGISRDDRNAGEHRGVGLRISGFGNQDQGALDEARRRLQEAFPEARISI